jgi:hypothetical protein
METTNRNATPFQTVTPELATVAASHAAIAALSSAEHLVEGPDAKTRGGYLIDLAQDAVDRALAQNVEDDIGAFSRSIEVLALAKTLGVTLPVPEHSHANEHLLTIAQHVDRQEVLWNLSERDPIIAGRRVLRSRVLFRDQNPIDPRSRQRFCDLADIARKTFGRAFGVVEDNKVAPRRKEISALQKGVEDDFALWRRSANIAAARASEGALLYEGAGPSGLSLRDRILRATALALTPSESRMHKSIISTTID